MTRFVDPVSQPCNNCPFRRKSMPGWLGAGSPESFIDCMQRDEPLPCHQTVDYDDEHWLAKWMLQRDSKMKMCAGALVFMRNKLQNNPFAKVEKDHENIFSNSVEFVRHHREASTHSWKEEDQEPTAHMHRKIIAEAAEKMGKPIIDFAARSGRRDERLKNIPLQNIPIKKRNKSR